MLFNLYMFQNEKKKVFNKFEINHEQKCLHIPNAVMIAANTDVLLSKKSVEQTKVLGQLTWARITHQI